MRTMLWYDLETFGLNPHYDRIAQAAAVRTDMELNIIGEPLLLYSALTPDYLPSPDAALVTGLTPQYINERGMKEVDMITRLQDEMMKPETITVGYNSLRFDDECVRTTLYRNLYDPYEREYANHCSRWDLINFVRATKDLRPDGMVFDKKNEDGFTSFRLTDLTEENHIEQEGAHDALVDVYATIGVARMIKKNCPKLWDYAVENRQRNQVFNIVNPNKRVPFLCTSAAFITQRGSTHALLPLFLNGKNDLWCYDLTAENADGVDPNDYKSSGIFKLTINKYPFVAPLSTLDSESEKRLGFTKAEVLNKAKNLKVDLNRERILNSVLPYEKAERDVDVDLYGGFLTPNDKITLSHIRTLSPKEKHDGNFDFEDPRYSKILKRQIARSWPEELTESERKAWKAFSLARLNTPPTDTAFSLETYRTRCNELLIDESLEEEKKPIVKALLSYADELEAINKEDN